jgi:hypothetical protein
MTGQDYALTSTFVWIGIIVGAPIFTPLCVCVFTVKGEFPANRAIQVFPAAKLLGASMIIWGLVRRFPYAASLLTHIPLQLLIPSGLILDYRPLFAFRFLLGFFESVIAPCLLAITVMCKLPIQHQSAGGLNISFRRVQEIGTASRICGLAMYAGGQQRDQWSPRLWCAFLL